jgi:hypothetical protein
LPLLLLLQQLRLSGGEKGKLLQLQLQKLLQLEIVLLG